MNKNEVPRPKIDVDQNKENVAAVATTEDEAEKELLEEDAFEEDETSAKLEKPINMQVQFINDLI